MGKKNKNKKKKGFKNRPFYEKIAIPASIFTKIRALTMEAQGEISGFGRTTLMEEKHSMKGAVVQVKEFEVFKQVCNPAHTTLSGEELTQMYVGVAQKGGKPEEWNFWWHSHVDFDTGFSGEDDNTMKRISDKGGMIVALCTNKFGDYDATIYKNGKRLMERIPLMIVPDLTEEVVKDAQNIISEKVDFESYSLGTYEKEFGSNLANEELEKIEEIELGMEDIENLSGFVPPRKLKLSKNRERKQKRYQRHQRQPGWAVRS